MNTQSTTRSLPRADRRAVALAACLATVLAGNARAVAIPDLPLETGGKYPPANILFILDDSLSMGGDFLPDGLASGDLNQKSYVNNLIYYNPSITYQSWIQGNGTRVSGGTTLNSVFDHDYLVGSSGSPTSIVNTTQTYYVPKGATTSPPTETQYYRYQIIEADAGTASAQGKVVRSEWLTPLQETTYEDDVQTNDTTTTVHNDIQLSVSSSNRWVSNAAGGSTAATAPAQMGPISASYTLPALLANQAYVAVEVRTTGASNNAGRDAELYVRRGSAPDTSMSHSLANGRCVRTTNNSSNETCTFDTAGLLTAGSVWHFGVRSRNTSGGDFSNVRFFFTYTIRTTTTVQVPVMTWNPRNGEPGAGCTGTASNPATNFAWRECTFMTPTGRSETEEKTNYATWYSYHRTRMKVAKAGASEAFSQVGDYLRVGFDGIGRTVTSGAGGTAKTGPEFPIPVDTDGGRFRDSNKVDWYNKLHEDVGDNYTPLRGALNRAGLYFSSDAPWGGTGDTLLTCRQNFAILTSDGYWNTTDDGTISVGDADSVAGNSGQTAHQPAPGIPRDPYTYSPASPYRDNMCNSNNYNTIQNCTAGHSQSNTLADVAMYYWKRDLRPSMQNDVPISPDSEAFWQNMVTFGVSLGAVGLLDESDVASIRGGTSAGKHWPKVNLNANTATSASENPTWNANVLPFSHADDLLHASVNGRGKYVVANNSKEFAEGLQDAFAAIAQRVGSASNVAANSASISTGTRVFQAAYTSGTWTGELRAFVASSAGVAATPSWVASDGIPAFASREIFTWDEAEGEGADFPTDDQLALLDVSARAEGPASAAVNLAYIKGDRSNTNLRSRSTVLGDIINSSPFYARDTGTIYVGSNDGMLHAFDAAVNEEGEDSEDAGTELFAYVPGSLNMTALADLSNPRYSHKYYVDGPVVVSTRQQTTDKNILVGSLGRGGKALFGLDVTDPASFSADDVLWELGGDSDLGQVLGEPLIARLNDGDRTEVVIVGNGTNSTNGSAVLMVIDIATGDVLHRLDTGVGGDNALFAPRGADLDLSGTVDAVYAGDIKGNVWKFDFSGATPTIALGGTPLFVTSDPDDSSLRQPITGGIALGRSPSPDRKVWVFFGTGKFLETDDLDLSLAEVQSVYGIIDETTETLSRDDLRERGILAVQTVNGRTVRGFEPVGTLEGEEKGWVLDLDEPTVGERVITRPELSGNVLVFSSRIPSTNDDPCNPRGSGFLNALAAFSGTSTENPYFDGDGDGLVDGDDTIVGEDGQEVPIGSVDLGVGMPTQQVLIDEIAIVCGSEGSCGSIVINPPGGEQRRASWTEIIPD